MINRHAYLLFFAAHMFCSIFVYGQAKKENADTIITGGLVVSMDSARHIYNDGAIVVTGDSIVAVGPRSEIEAKYVSQNTIDAEGKMVLPGFINGHTHVPMTLFRGLHDDVTLNGLALQVHLSGREEECYRRVRALGNQARSSGADSGWSDHIRRHVLLRRRGGGGNKSGGHAGRVGRNTNRFPCAR